MAMGLSGCLVPDGGDNCRDDCILQAQEMVLALSDKRITFLPLTDKVFNQGVCPYVRHLEAYKIVNIQQDVENKPGKEVLKGRNIVGEQSDEQKEFNRMEDADSEIGYRVKVLVHYIPEISEHA